MYVSEMPDESTLLEFFPAFRDNMHLITNNRYFHIEKKKKPAKKDMPKQSQKGRMSKTEWFESLDVEERVEALSTVATENHKLIECIWYDIKKIQSKYNNIDNQEEEAYSNEDYLNTNLANSTSKGYFSQKWNICITPEFPDSIHSVINNFTFLDYKTPEDTISVLDEFVIDPTEFFHVLESSWNELRGADPQIITRGDRTIKRI